MKCLLCGGKESIELYDFANGNAVQCSSCSLIFTDSGKRKKIDKHYWSKPNNKFFDYYYGERLKSLHRFYIKTLKHYISEREKVLDLGAGLGYFVHDALDADINIEGYEPGKVGRDYAREHLGISLNGGSLSKIRKKYGAIVCFHTLEHVPSPRAFVKHIFRLLKPGGIVVIEVPNIASPLNKIRGKSAYDTNAHTLFFTKQTLEELFTGHSFEILKLVTRQSRRTTFFVSLLRVSPKVRDSIQGGEIGQGKNLLQYKLIGVLDLFFTPIRNIFSKLGWGDELYLVARKLDKE